MSADAHANGESLLPSVTSTSRSLLARLKQQDSDAWQRLVRLYTPLVCCWCARSGLPEQDMPDVVQDVFRAVAANIQRFRKSRPQDSFRGWLRTITRSKVVDHFRRQQRQPQAAGGTVAQRRLCEVPTDEGEEEFDRPERNTLLLSALELIRGGFQERTWQAFWRTAVDGRSPQDVAEELAMRPGTVRVAKSRVLHRLRKELGELDD